MSQFNNLIVAGGFSLLAVAGPTSAQPAEDEHLKVFFHHYLEAQHRQQPLEATSLGDHRFDSQLDDISPAARAGWQASTRLALQQLPQQVDYRRLSRDGQVDFEILQHHFREELWLADHTHPFAEDPRVYGGYLNDSVYLLVAQSTLAKETNIANAIARMAQMPRIIAEAEKSLTHPPKRRRHQLLRKRPLQLHRRNATAGGIESRRGAGGGRVEGLSEISRRPAPGPG